MTNVLSTLDYERCCNLRRDAEKSLTGLFDRLEPGAVVDDEMKADAFEVTQLVAGIEEVFHNKARGERLSLICRAS